MKAPQGSQEKGQLCGKAAHDGRTSHIFQREKKKSPAGRRKAVA